MIERNNNYLKNKDIKLNNLITSEDIECTFSPKINKQVIIQDENDKIEVGDRLYQYSLIYKSNNEKRIEENKGKDVENYTFTPKINPNTYEILKNKEFETEEIKKKYELDKINVNKSKNINSYTNQINEIEEYTNESDSIQERNTINSNYNNNIKTTNNNKVLNKSLSNKKLSLSKSITSNNNINLDKQSNNLSKASLANSNLKDNSLELKTYSHKSPLALYSMSDNKLLELANNYIATDESLEAFQARLKEKYKNLSEDKKAYAMVINQNLKEKIKIENNLTAAGLNLNFEADKHLQIINENNKTIKNTNKKKDLMSKNISKALEYYKLAEA